MRIRHDAVSTPMQEAPGRVLLTGATGYVGGRLLRKLEESGRLVRCMVRRPEVLSGRAAEQTEIVHGDILDPDSLHDALAGVTTPTTSFIRWPRRGRSRAPIVAARKTSQLPHVGAG